MLAADCLNVGLFRKAICCSSSSVIVFCSEVGVCARPGKATKNKAQKKQSMNRVTQRRCVTVSTFTSIKLTAVIKLFMFVLHTCHVHCLVAFLLFSTLHDVGVILSRHNTPE